MTDCLSLVYGTNINCTMDFPFANSDIININVRDWCVNNPYIATTYCDKKELYDGVVNHYDLDSNLVACEDLIDDNYTVECLT